MTTVGRPDALKEVITIYLLEDTKEAIKSRKSQDRQCNDQKQKDTNDKQ